MQDNVNALITFVLQFAMYGVLAYTCKYTHTQWFQLFKAAACFSDLLPTAVGSQTPNTLLSYNDSGQVVHTRVYVT